MSVASYNTNPALNTAISGIDISEGSAAAGYNNALRQIMADIAVWTAANAISYPVTLAHGGTGATTAAAALTAIGASGGTFGGPIKQTSYGAYPHFASTSVTQPRIFVQAAGSDPTSQPGDIVFEF